MVNREDLICKTNKYIYNFQQFEAIRYFVKNIFPYIITLNDVDKKNKSERCRRKKA